MYVAYGACSPDSVPSPTGRRSGPGARSASARRWASPASACIATVLASLPYYVAGFADQPAASGLYDYDGPAELWNVLVTIGHGVMFVVVLAFAGLWLRSLRDDDAGPPTTRGRARRWSG